MTQRFDDIRIITIASLIPVYFFRQLELLRNLNISICSKKAFIPARVYLPVLDWQSFVIPLLDRHSVKLCK